MLCIRAEICNLCPVPSLPSLRISSLSNHLSHSSSTNCVILSRFRSLSWQQAMEYRYNSCSVRLQYIPPDITTGDSESWTPICLHVHSVFFSRHILHVELIVWANILFVDACLTKQEGSFRTVRSGEKPQKSKNPTFGYHIVVMYTYPTPPHTPMRHLPRPVCGWAPSVCRQARSAGGMSSFRSLSRQRARTRPGVPIKTCGQSSFNISLSWSARLVLDVNM